MEDCRSRYSLWRCKGWDWMHSTRVKYERVGTSDSCIYSEDSWPHWHTYWHSSTRYGHKCTGLVQIVWRFNSILNFSWGASNIFGRMIMLRISCCCYEFEAKWFVQTMAWILDEYSKFHGHSPAVVTGKPIVSNQDLKIQETAVFDEDHSIDLIWSLSLNF